MNPDAACDSCARRGRELPYLVAFDDGSGFVFLVCEHCAVLAHDTAGAQVTDVRGVAS